MVTTDAPPRRSRDRVIADKAKAVPTAENRGISEDAVLFSGVFRENR